MLADHLLDLHVILIGLKLNDDLAGAPLAYRVKRQRKQQTQNAGVDEAAKITRMRIHGTKHLLHWLLVSWLLSAATNAHSKVAGRPETYTATPACQAARAEFCIAV